MNKLKLATIVLLLSFGFTTQAIAKKIPTPDEAPAGVKMATEKDILDVFHSGGEVYDVR